MTEKKHITVSDLDSGETIKRLVHEKCPLVLCVFPGTVSRSEDFQRSVLIVTGGGPEQIVSLLGNDHLPKYTPILYLGSGDSVPDFIGQDGSNRLIDYLGAPVSIQIFLHRVSLLKKVQNISAEHHSNRTTLSQQLNVLSTRDGLTGLFNRRHLTIRLIQTFQMAQADGGDLSLLILNIDFFNTINKTTGLEFGDFILNELAARLTETTEATATCYRFSGEDFVVLLPGAGLKHACAVADQIRKVCSEKPFTDGKHTISITISVGIASLKDHTPDNHDEIICMAEAALFMAKAEGRNRFQAYSPHNGPEEFSPKKSLAFLKEDLNRILEKTRNSAIASLQLLAKNIAGSEHQAHIANVSHFVALLGEHIGLPEQHTRTFQNSITLYNSFRFLLHNDLLSKPGKLTSEERKTIEDLPFKLNELTEMFDYFAEERNILLGHSERYDGTGYPLGLKGDEISLGARIFNIVDSLAAMSSERPYRRKLSPPEIIEELKKEAGKQFDPYLVLQILAVIKKNDLFNLDAEFLDRSQQDLLNTFPKLKS
ncbi:MAG: diguanylate cyclase [Desulfobulbaceae bacterium]|nr:diguanylate cyclase [Desulfobulbaceae bacterium]